MVFLRPCIVVSIFFFFFLHDGAQFREDIVYRWGMGRERGRKKEETYQLLKHAAIQVHLRLSALPQTVVVVLKTLPVRIELLQAVGVDILDPALSMRVSYPSILSSSPCINHIMLGFNSSTGKIQ